MMFLLNKNHLQSFFSTTIKIVYGVYSGHMANRLKSRVVIRVSLPYPNVLAGVGSVEASRRIRSISRNRNKLNLSMEPEGE